MAVAKTSISGCIACTVILLGCVTRSSDMPQASQDSFVDSALVEAHPPSPPETDTLPTDVATAESELDSMPEESGGGEVAIESPAPPAESDVPPEPALPSVRDVIERVDDAVVLITTLDAQGRENAVGSGFVIDRSGLVATNYHVVRMAHRAHAQLRDGRKIDFEGVYATDKGRDLAVLQLRDPPDDLEVIELRQPEKLVQGDALIAVGHPSSFKFTVTTGIVSAVRSTEELPDQFKAYAHWPDDQVWIQTNAAISHGNSGGPLFDRHGTLVGINTWIDPQGQNLGFATHVQHLAELMDSDLGESQPLPLPGSEAARTLTNPQVITIQEAFGRKYMEFQQQQATVNLFSMFSKVKDPAPASIQELLDLADKNQGTDTGFQALWSACAIARLDSDKHDEALQQTLNRIIEHYADNPRLDNIAIEVASVGTEPTFAFLRKLLSDSPHRHVRATACYCLATGIANSNRARAAQPEVVHYFQQSIDDFGDMYLEVYTGTNPVNVTKIAEHGLFSAKHLTPGKTPPNIVGKDHAGEPLELADHRGKVVLLTFSADWEEHCRRLYEPKRRWMEQYADQPFVVLDVSVDTPDRMAHLVNEKTVTWRAWADGPKGPIVKQWRINTVPTVMILDRQGVVRSALWPLGDDFIERVEEAIEVTLAQPFSEPHDDLLASGASWKHITASDEIDQTWRTADFDDSSWSEGVTPLGFGLYDEATALSFDPTATQQWTTLLRCSFDVTDPQAMQDVVLSLRCDDGAAVFLNGTQVVRLRLAENAAFDDPATFDDYSDGRHSISFPIDASLLVSGRNVIAVELHQAERSSDLRFDLAIGSNVISSLLEAASGDQPVRRLDAIQMLGRLGPAASSATPMLEGLLADKDMRVRSRALETLLLIDPSRSANGIPEAADEREKKYRLYLNRWLNNEGWSLGFAKDNAPDNYERAWRSINAACALAPKEGAAVNTKGTIEYRLGRYEDAIKTLNESIRMQRDNPFDHAVIAMSQFRLEQVDKARQSLDKAQKALDRIDSSEDRDQAEYLVNEATSLIGLADAEGPAPAAPSPFE